jgi:sodium/potassium-transporting ATPase subunit alpha
MHGKVINRAFLHHFYLTFGVPDFSTSRVMASITGMLPADVRVIRDGSAITIPAPSLVTGDLVDIVLGQKIPADLRLVKVGGDLRFDRSILTGESDAIAGTLNSTSDNFLESQFYRCFCMPLVC